MVQDDDVANAVSGIAPKQWEKASLGYKKIDPETIQVCTKVAPNEMEGISVLWKIAMDCQTKKVGEGVTNMLLQVHTQVDFGLDDKITMFEDQFVESCMHIIAKQKEIIEARSPERIKELNDAYEPIYRGITTPSKLKKVLPVEESRIISCLSYIKMLVLNSERDGMNGIIPHSALDQSKILDNITIQNTYEGMNSNGFRNRFTIQVASNATIYMLK